MAVVHPSRMGLVPQDTRQDESKTRRASPEYDDYQRRPPPQGEPPVAPWRREERGQNMYGSRAQGRNGYSGGGSSADYLESRRQQRAASTFSIWPPSPKVPAREFSPERSSKSRRRRRRRSPSTDSTTSSSEDERRRRKERKRSRRTKDRDHSRERDIERRRNRHRSRSRSVDEDRRRRTRSRSADEDRNRSRTKSRQLSSPTSEGEEWIEKPSLSERTAPPPSTSPPVKSGPASSTRLPLPTADSDSDTDMGPQPLPKPAAPKKIDERQYGGALLRGEGAAMAAFLQGDDSEDPGNSRIPRRGEIGLDALQIDQFERAGYVMSGSRHHRMNAVRMRKENQVISAEEKRGILKLQREERERREQVLREEFKDLVGERLKAQQQSSL